MIKSKNIDSNITKKLIDYSNSIANIYNELYKLEIEGKKNTKEYDSLIYFIKFMKNKEQYIYDSIPSEYLQEYLKYFRKIEKELSQIKAPVLKILFSENTEYIIIRITNQLDYMLEEVWKYEEEEALEQIEDDEDLIFLSSLNIENTIKKEMEIDEFQEYVLNTSIIFLDELIEKIDDTVLRQQLQKLKFINSFSNPIIEDEYLACNLELNLNSIDRYNYRKMKHVLKCAYSCAVAQIKGSISKSVYTDPKTFIINLSLLKAYLYFLSEFNILKLINILYSINKNEPEFEKVKTKVIEEMKDTLNKLPE